MTSPSDQAACVACGQDQNTAPLIAIAYKDNTYWICSQHLPVLIHNPHMLAGKIPGAEGMKPADHQD